MWKDEKREVMEAVEYWENRLEFAEKQIRRHQERLVRINQLEKLEEMKKELNQ